jgi:hypothetical protein
MLIPNAHAIGITIEGNATARDRLELIDDLATHRAHVARLGVDGNAGALALTREIEQVSDNVPNAIRSTRDDRRAHFRGAGRVGELCEPARRQLNSIERVTNVVAHDRKNPLFEVPRERELLLIVLLLRQLSFAAFVDVYATADVTSKCS